MLTRSRPLSLSSATLIQFIPLPFHCFKIHCNIILPSTPRYFKWALSFRFPHHKPACISPLPAGQRAAWPAIQLILLDSFTLTVSDEEHQIMKFLIMHFCKPSVAASLKGPNAFLSTIFSDTLKPCPPPPLNVRDQVHHPHKTIGEVVSPCILIFVFLYKRRDISRCLVVMR
jgi:hypothetical protein